MEGRLGEWGDKTEQSAMEDEEELRVGKVETIATVAVIREGS